MAATLIKAVAERYDAHKAAQGWPTLWFGVQPPGEARTFPNVVLSHLGESPYSPNEYMADGAGGIVKAAVNGRVRLTAYVATAADPATVEDLMLTIQPVMEDPDTPFTVGGDTNVWLFRENYQVAPTTQQGPNGQFVFAAVTTYRAMFNP